MYTIIFANQTIITETQATWRKLPSIPIDRIYYKFPNNKTILLEGFESYIYILEYHQFLLNFKGRKLITINLLGKYNNEVYQISWHHKGYLMQKKNQWGKEFTPLIWNPISKKFEAGKARPTNISFWKVGIKLPQAKAKIIKI